MPDETDQLARLNVAFATRYRVERVLGHGGMATVFLAQDLKHTRPVALKVLRPELAATLGSDRFLREVRITASLNHPHILPLLDSGAADGFVYYTMPYVEGESLRARLDREQQLPLDDAIQIAREVADALHYAHSHDFVHRDIKPENILLESGHAVVADFGIARAITAAGGESLTETGIAVGTPAYMSPEQASAEHLIDGRSDVYSLACVVYEMLAGQPPYTGATAAAILARKAVEAVPSLRVVRASVPAGVEQALTQGLAKVPADRFATASQFAQALQRGAYEQRPRPPRRLLRRVLIGGAMAAVLMGATVLAVRIRERRAAALGSVVVMPFENRTGDASLDPVGAITADWVAQGLNEPGFLTVLDTRSALAAGRTLGAGASPMAVGRETGAGVVVVGSYFEQGDSLQFQARIVSAGDGSILASIGRIVAPRARLQAGVEQLRQQALAALASLHDKDVANFQTSLSQPPTYDAYREYAEGLAQYMRFDYPAAAQQFERAAALDPTFLTARLWAAQSTLWFPTPHRVDSILAELKPLRDRLRPFDRARFDYIVALREAQAPVLTPGGWKLTQPDHETDPLQVAYQAALRMVDAAPGSVDARREAALSALRVFRPREALRLLEALDPEHGLMREWALGYWDSEAWGHHLLGEHDEELVAARRAHEAGLGRFDELRALAALGRVEEFDSLAHAWFRADPQSARTAYALAGELLAHGHPELARRLAHDAAELVAAHPPPDSTGAQGRDGWLGERAWLALLLGDTATAAECIAHFRNPEKHGFLVAQVLAAQGRREAALEALEAAKRRVTLVGGALDRHMALKAAGVLVRLGDRNGAVDALEQTSATDPYLLADSGWDGHAEPELAPLWNDPRFKALIKPRG